MELDLYTVFQGKVERFEPAQWSGLLKDGCPTPISVNIHNTYFMVFAKYLPHQDVTGRTKISRWGSLPITWVPGPSEALSIALSDPNYVSP